MTPITTTVVVSVSACIVVGVGSYLFYCLVRAVFTPEPPCQHVWYPIVVRGNSIGQECKTCGKLQAFNPH